MVWAAAFQAAAQVAPLPVKVLQAAESSLCWSLVKSVTV